MRKWTFLTGVVVEWTCFTGVMPWFCGFMGGAVLEFGFNTCTCRSAQTCFSTVKWGVWFMLFLCAMHTVSMFRPAYGNTCITQQICTYSGHFSHYIISHIITNKLGFCCWILSTTMTGHLYTSCDGLACSEYDDAQNWIQIIMVESTANMYYYSEHFSHSSSCYNSS